MRDADSMVRLGELLAQGLAPGDVVYLMGELGAGKTTLARGIARGLGYLGQVTSPTFTLMNIYAGRVPIYHCDFYRLEEGDIHDLGIEDYLERDGVTLVEWPERLLDDLPGRAFYINIEVQDGDYEGPRLVTVIGKGAEYEGRMEELNRIVGAGFGNCDPGGRSCPDK